MVKKIIITVLSIVILITLSIWGFWYYKRVQSFAVSVPQKAGYAVRLNLEQVGAKLLRSGQGSGDDKKVRRQYGLELPFNVFFFGWPELPASCLLSRWHINDRKAFRNFLHSEFSTKDSLLWTHNSTMLSCVYAEHSVVFITQGTPGAEAIARAQDYLQGKALIPFDESPWAGLRQASGDLSIIAGWGRGNLDFEKGQVRASMDLPVGQADWVSVAPASTARIMDLHAGCNFAAMLQQLFPEALPDNQEIASCLKPGFHLSIDGQTTQQEQVVTYDYDEQFEKVARVGIQERSVPDMRLQLPLRDTACLSVFSQQELLLAPDSVNKASFPLWSLWYTHTGDEGLQISSRKGYLYPADTAVVQPDLVLDFWSDMARLHSVPPFTDVATYTHAFRTLRIRGIRKDSMIRVTATLQLADTNKASVRQLMDLF